MRTFGSDEALVVVTVFLRSPGPKMADSLTNTYDGSYQPMKSTLNLAVCYVSTDNGALF